ncbi:MAG: phosphate signaling complex protein PhoU [Burkholderiaceae bacterium]|nr:phosphate signaling complex protein PhoU [Burkholderiaceae bacterium]
MTGGAGHSSKQYDAELGGVQAKVLEMGKLVEMQFRDAVHAFCERDGDVANRVILRDGTVNRLEVALDEACIRLIVRRQPTADDLRTTVAALKVSTDLERIGDEITKIARSVKDLQADGTRLDNYDLFIHSMADTAAVMLHDALSAYERMDKVQAVHVIAMDDVLDSVFNEMMRSLVEFMAVESASTASALNILWVAKAMERIGDHATNIGEHVVYGVSGIDIRHTDFVQRQSAVPARDAGRE